MERDQLIELLQQCRGSVKKDWTGYERLAMVYKTERPGMQAVAEAEAARLFAVLEAIDALCVEPTVSAPQQGPIDPVPTRPHAHGE